MSTTLLDKVFETEVGHLAERLRGTYQTLSLDGWSSPTNVSMIGVAVGGELIAVHDGDDRHTTDALVRIANDAIEKCRTQFNCAVVAVVGDHASSMLTVRQQVSANSPVLAIGCSAHLLHLVVSDFMKHSGR